VLLRRIGLRFLLSLPSLAEKQSVLLLLPLTWANGSLVEDFSIQSLHTRLEWGAAWKHSRPEGEKAK